MTDDERGAAIWWFEGMEASMKAAVLEAWAAEKRRGAGGSQEELFDVGGES